MKAGKKGVFAAEIALWLALILSWNYPEVISLFPALAGLVEGCASMECVWQQFVLCTLEYIKPVTVVMLGII